MGPRSKAEWAALIALAGCSATAQDVESEGSRARESAVGYAACHTALAEVDGVWAYSNDWATGTGSSCGGQLPSGALRYQCVELAQRYMRALYGTPEIWPVAVAAEMCWKNPAGTTVHWHGDGYLPVRGDLAVWTDNNYGHVAVVRSSWDGGIEIVEQNASAEGVRTLSGDPGSGYWSSWGTSPDCFIRADGNTGSHGTGSGDGGAGGSSPSSASCEALGYEGKCFADVSAWSENGSCWVRDCAGEDKSCGWISNEIGWGCLGGTDGASTLSCGDLGYEGNCFGDVVAWVEEDACRVVDCAASGRSCAMDGANGYDCVK